MVQWFRSLIYRFCDVEDEREMAKYKALDIARWFILRSNVSEEFDGGDRLSLLKLLKLMYYAEGCSLAINNTSLFSEAILAWEHGPVVESIWRYYHDDPYNLPYNPDEEQTSIDLIEKDDKELLEDVFLTFGKYSAWGLRNKTHEETPWIKASKHGTDFSNEIDRQIMKEYFSENYVA